MGSPSAKTLASAILKRRGAAGYEALITKTFTSLPKGPAGLELAWKVLELADERACWTKSRKGSNGYFEREVRVLGPVVAWRDSRVMTSRSLTKPGRVELRVLASPAAALEVANAAVAGSKEERWGVRPAAGEPATTSEHRAVCKALLAGGDVAKLKAYRKRYAGTAILMTFERDGAPRQVAFAIWDINSVVQQAAQVTDDPKIWKVLLADEPHGSAVRAAIDNALEAGRTKLVPRLVPLVDDVNKESFNDTLLARAVRLGRLDAVKVLLQAGADPNHVYGTGGLSERLQPDPEEGNGPMVNAVRNGDVPMLKVLMGAGGDPYGKTATGQRVFDYAKKLGAKAVLKQLASKGEAPPLDMEGAIVNGDLARVLELVPKEGLEDLLRICGNDGHPDVLRAALAVKKVKKDREQLAMALYYSAFGGFAENVAILLEHGADPNGYEGISVGPTARAAAELKKHTAIAAMLAKAGGKLRPGKK